LATKEIPAATPRPRLQLDLQGRTGPQREGSWRGIDNLEIAVAEYLDWHNHQRLHSELGGLLPSIEHETNHHHTTAPVSTPSG
jgi:hypothetical protein